MDQFENITVSSWETQSSLPFGLCHPSTDLHVSARHPLFLSSRRSHVTMASLDRHYWSSCILCLNTAKHIPIDDNTLIYLVPDTSTTSFPAT